MMLDDIEEVLFSEEVLRRRVAELGRQIAADYADRAQEGIVLLAVLRGAAPFAADLARAIDLPLELDFLRASSYGMQAVSSGTVQVDSPAAEGFAGKHVIVVEDILDTGTTMAHLLQLPAFAQAASVAVAALLVKENRPERRVSADYTGFSCPDAFMVGYGLDYAERYRNLPFIGSLKSEIYQHD